MEALWGTSSHDQSFWTEIDERLSALENLEILFIIWSFNDHELSLLNGRYDISVCH